MAYRRRGWGGPRNRPPKLAIKETFSGPFAKTRKDGSQSRQRCHGCQGWIVYGDVAKRLTLSKRYRHPCGSCGTAPHGSRWFHERCMPADINKAMGYDPTSVNPNAYAPPNPSVAPPPKPKNAMDVSLDALVALEAAVIAKARERGVTPAMEKAFKTFQNIKARVLRPGTPGEADAAVNVALKRIIDLVYG